MQEIINGSTIKKAGNHIEAVVDGEVVLMHFESGKFFSLSDTSQRAWELMDGVLSFEELVSRVMAEYDVTREICEAEMREFLQALDKRTLIEIK